MTKNLKLCPIGWREASAFVKKHHSHHKVPQGWKFGTSVMKGEKVVGVVMAGRPVSRMLDTGFTLEVTRCCTDRTKNAASMLYGSVRRAAFALGYEMVITYTLEKEAGTSLKAAGWEDMGLTGGGS